MRTIHWQSQHTFALPTQKQVASSCPHKLKGTYVHVQPKQQAFTLAIHSLWGNFLIFRVGRLCDAFRLYGLLPLHKTKNAKSPFTTKYYKIKKTATNKSNTQQKTRMFIQQSTVWQKRGTNIKHATKSANLKWLQNFCHGEGHSLHFGGNYPNFYRPWICDFWFGILRNNAWLGSFMCSWLNLRHGAKPPWTDP